MRREVPHYTEQQVTDHIEAALAIVDEIDPAGDLRRAVFTAAVNLLSAKQIVEEQFQPPVLSGKL